MYLCRVDSIAYIMTFAITHISNQTFGLTKMIANKLNNINISHLIMSADIINLACSVLMNNEVNGLAVISNIQPISYIKSLSIYRKRLIIRRICNHQRNHFFGKVVWSVVVGTTADSHRQIKCSVIRQNKQVGTIL